MDEEKTYVEEANDSTEISESNSENSSGSMLVAGLIGAGVVIAGQFAFKHVVKPGVRFIANHLPKKDKKPEQLEEAPTDGDKSE